MVPSPPLGCRKCHLFLLFLGKVLFWHVAQKKSSVFVTKMVFFPSQNAILRRFALWDTKRGLSVFSWLVCGDLGIFHLGFASSTSPKRKIWKAALKKGTRYFRHPRGGSGGKGAQSTPGGTGDLRATPRHSAPPMTKNALDSAPLRATPRHHSCPPRGELQAQPG